MYSESIEQRQHLNLSSRAFSVIMEDSRAFMAHPTLSGFINTVLSCFGEVSEANIRHAVMLKEQYLRSIIGAERDQAAEKMIRRLCTDYAEGLKSRFSAFPKDEAVKIRLNNENYRALYDDAREPDWTYSGFYRSPGQFIKAVLEDYASRPLYEREGIFFEDRIRELEGVIHMTGADKPLVKIRMEDNGSVPGKVYIVKPVCVTSDTYGNYHYLAGYMRDADSDGPMVPASLRVSRIAQVRIMARSYGSGKITAVEGSAFEQLLKKRDIAFLLSPECSIRVRIDTEGERMLRQIQHLRPAVIERTRAEDGNGDIFTFGCSEYQAYAYFRNFGKHAVILEPAQLRERFVSFFSESAAAYSEE